MKINNIDILNILSDKKVLYAEDEDGIRNKVIDILEIFFERVVAVCNGKEAVEEMSFGNYDVLIFDICMPNMDGLDAVKKIRKKNKKIPVIILSAHTEQNYLWRAIELKITKFLIKPFNINNFLKALEKVALELVDYNMNIKLKNGCIYNPAKKTVSYGNKNINLSKKESRLLEFLIQNANKVVSFDEISNYVWEYEYPSKEAVKSLVKEIRRKIGSQNIKNIYSIGYIFEI
ncbi:response regulator transcription factor [Lebetimonas sp. JS170]|uniref:response regulator transcription factor n=1 Tax=Lebetimonas sp. JS170 TaxID=990073 RepID=UPI0004B8D20D|nr:response regulator transcription factor [Lebetimonas sp. JS170]